MKKIGIASDHAGYEMKEFLVGYLNAMGYEVLDFGAHSPESVDYADFAHPLAEAIENGELERGVALCGSGEGMTMTLNKHQGIRAGLCWDTEIASLIRLPGALHHQRRSRQDARRLFRRRVRRRTPYRAHRQDARGGLQIEPPAPKSRKRRKQAPCSTLPTASPTPSTRGAKRTET